MKNMKKIKKVLTILLTITIALSFTACITEEDLQAKFDEGYEAGYEEGYNEGDNDGYHRGYDYGYEDGYDEAEVKYENEDFLNYNDSDDNDSYTVYVTNYGSKYHASWCGSLWSSSNPISKSNAIASGYEPCERCNP